LRSKFFRINSKGLKKINGKFLWLDDYLIIKAKKYFTDQSRIDLGVVTGIYSILVEIFFSTQVDLVWVAIGSVG